MTVDSLFKYLTFSCLADNLCTDLKACWTFKIGIEAGIFQENQIVIISDWAHQTVDALGFYWG